MIGLKQRKVKGITLKIRLVKWWLVVVLVVFWFLSLVLLIISYQVNETTQYLLLLMAVCFIIIISIDTYIQYSLYQYYQRGQLKTKNILIHALQNDQQRLQTKLINSEKNKRRKSTTNCKETTMDLPITILINSKPWIF